MTIIEKLLIILCSEQIASKKGHLLATSLKRLRIDYCDERLVYLYHDSSGDKGGTYVFDTSAESSHIYLSNDIQ